MHMFVDVVVLVDICYIIFAYPMFNFTLYDQIEQDLRRQREIAGQQHEIAKQQLEIANQRASIMVLQMRPLLPAMRPSRFLRNWSTPAHTWP